jgi:glutamate synthase domain-containing protein 2
MVTLMLSYQRYAVFTGVALLTIASFIGAVYYSEWLLIITAISSSLLGLGVYDIFQSRHAILRNYPIIGHMRFILESIRPELRQYIIEGDRDEEPFSREIRGLVYQRAKGVEDKRPFGTIENVYSSGYAWLTHSAVPMVIKDTDFRVHIGGSACKQPYDASL